VRSGGTADAGSSFQGQRALVPYPSPGDRIDSFELDTAIGVGGMGAVYRAVDRRLDREVALKILPPDQAHDPEVVQRFYQEARAAARLDHENIARVYTIGEDGSYHFIAFEYIEGATIRQRVQDEGLLSVAEAINFTLQIASALVHATERGVVHRDIKPSNIVVTAHGRAKLVDMGLARRFERGVPLDDGLTQSGMTLGTFDYISPEQARDPRDVDVRSDLYSLGCTLYFMLSGRPPFPDGTVLQKLLQHQEEPAPDVRALNPAVPPELAAVVLKLMAKQRERRYQTPEQLVRDLLQIAGSLGLRSISPEGLVWLAAAPAPGWERHLVWSLPVVALILVVAGLGWWGQTPESPRLAADAAPIAPPTIANGSRERPPPDGRARAQPSPTIAAPAAPASVVREVRVESSASLARYLKDLPAGSTIILADDGPFVLPPSAISERFEARMGGLTLKAAPGARPVLQAAGPVRERAAIVAFRGGRVVLEGIEFRLDAATELAAVAVETVDLTVRRCTFRRIGPISSAGPPVAIDIQAGTPVAASERPLLTAVAESLFDGAGIRVRGPADVGLRDCMFAGAEPPVWLDNAGAAVAVPARLRMSHLSILAGDGPVFRVANTAATLRLDDSVIAPPSERAATLIATDDPDRLDWMGRGNLYAAIETYLQPVRGASDRPAIRRFGAWSDPEFAVREVESQATDRPVWEQSDPLRALARDDVRGAFALTAASRGVGEIGARSGPSGALVAALEGGSRLVSAPARPAVAPPSPPGRADVSHGTKSADDPTLAAALAEPPLTSRPMPAPPPPMPAVAAPGDERDPMTVVPPPMERPAAAREPVVSAATADGPRAAPASEQPSVPIAPDIPPRPTLPSEGAATVETGEKLSEELRDPASAGKTFVIAAGASFDLSTCDLRGPRRVVRGPTEPGAARPRFRFRPPTQTRAAAGLPVLFRIRSGALELQGIDLVLRASDAPTGGRWAAFGLWAGAELTLINCTVTVEGDHPRSAVVAIQAADEEVEIGIADPDPSAASFRATECLLRTGGDLIDVAAGRRADVSLTGTVLATGGCVAHGHGMPRGQSTEPIRLGLRQVTARARGGLVYLESAPGEPDLPVCEVTARDSIFTTTGSGGPLFRIDGQEALDGLQDRIRWEGHGVAYHRIQVYRRDQTAQLGNIPRSFDRPAWEVAVGPREDAPFHGEVRFSKPWDESRPPWSMTAEDVRLDPERSAQVNGADLSRIPAAPL
jgi:serine/threonine-protein kinase